MAQNKEEEESKGRWEYRPEWLGVTRLAPVEGATTPPPVSAPPSPRPPRSSGGRGTGRSSRLGPHGGFPLPGLDSRVPAKGKRSSVAPGAGR